MKIYKNIAVSRIGVKFASRIDTMFGSKTIFKDMEFSFVFL